MGMLIEESLFCIFAICFQFIQYILRKQTVLILVSLSDNRLTCYCVHIVGSEGDRSAADRLHENSRRGHTVWTASAASECAGEAGPFSRPCTEQVSHEDRYIVLNDSEVIQY